MADGEVKKNYFDILPDEMVIHTLSFVSIDSLLDCKLVCKKWHELINAHVYQEKASQENEFVNNGRGYFSFSQIDAITIRKLDFPWYVFYTICKYDPFNRNMVKNHCGQHELEHWRETNPYRSINWIVEQPPEGTDDVPDDPDFDGFNSCFATSFSKCIKTQKITFKDYGLTADMMKCLQPEIVVSEWYAGRFDCGCRYEFKAMIYDDNDHLIEQHDYNNVIQQWEGNHWIKVSHSFKNQGKASSLIIYHAGVDTQYWAGHYGAKISGSVVKVLLPIKLKSSKY